MMLFTTENTEDTEIRVQGAGAPAAPFEVGGGRSVRLSPHLRPKR
jgi:hypothetical protein